MRLRSKNNMKRKFDDMVKALDGTFVTNKIVKDFLIVCLSAPLTYLQVSFNCLWPSPSLPIPSLYLFTYITQTNFLL
jgi:hypothetical protein